MKIGLGKKIRNLLSIKTTEDFIDSSVLELSKIYGSNLIAIDLGCGGGQCVVNSSYSNFFSKIKLVDLFDKPSNEIINNIKTEFFSIDVTSFLKSIESNSIHFILAKDILEHINRSEGQTLIKECYRVLKNKGILIIQVPNGSSPFGLRNFNNDLTHIQFLGHKSLEDISKKEFYSNVCVYPVDEISAGKLGFFSAIFQKKFLEPLIQIFLSSSIGHCGKYFWTPNIIAINKKLSKESA